MFTDNIVNLGDIHLAFILLMIRLLSIKFLLLLSFGLSAQSDSEQLLDDIDIIAKRYLLSDTQKSQVANLIQKRDLNLTALEANQNLDEPQRSLKRSSIINGFKGSLQLVLNSDQRQLSNQNIIEQRKKRIAVIEALKKKGLTQAEILKQLDNN